MLRPYLLAGLLVLIVVGCRPDPAMHLGLSRPASAHGLATADDIALIPPGKKVLSDKVLTAIALERVTGRKPDPRRFIEVR